MLPSGEMGDQKRGACSAPHLFLFPNKREDKLLGKPCHTGNQNFRDKYGYLTIGK